MACLIEVDREFYSQIKAKKQTSITIGKTGNFTIFKDEYFVIIDHPRRSPMIWVKCLERDSGIGLTTNLDHVKIHFVILDPEVMVNQIKPVVQCLVDRGYFKPREIHPIVQDYFLIAYYIPSLEAASKISLLIDWTKTTYFSMALNLSYPILASLNFHGGLIHRQFHDHQMYNRYLPQIVFRITAKMLKIKVYVISFRGRQKPELEKIVTQDEMLTILDELDRYHIGYYVSS